MLDLHADVQAEFTGIKASLAEVKREVNISVKSKVYADRLNRGAGYDSYAKHDSPMLECDIGAVSKAAKSKMPISTSRRTPSRPCSSIANTLGGTACIRAGITDAREEREFCEFTVISVAAHQRQATTASTRNRQSTAATITTITS